MLGSVLMHTSALRYAEYGAEQCRVPCHNIRPPTKQHTCSSAEKSKAYPLLLPAPATKRELSPQGGESKRGEFHSSIPEIECVTYSRVANVSSAETSTAVFTDYFA